jgi:hypothetical protein
VRSEKCFTIVLSAECFPGAIDEDEMHVRDTHRAKQSAELRHHIILRRIARTGSIDSAGGNNEGGVVKTSKTLVRQAASQGFAPHRSYWRHPAVATKGAWI